jgi:hypothetical protein
MSLRPPSGAPPPTVAELGGEPLDLVALARVVCDRYREHYPDEDERYGAAGMDWCRHDNQWLLSWAVGDVIGATDLDEQAAWLARVLHGRSFPVERLAHDLRLAGDVVLEQLPPEQGTALDDVLRRAALVVLSLSL